MSKPGDTDEPFLSRWSRRKRETERDLSVPDAAEPSTAAVDAGAPPGATAETEPELDLSKLPRVEELTETSDITAFLDKRVPAMLRNAALARVWTLDPTIRDFIEVAENQWNWNVPGGAPFYCEMEPGTGPGDLLAEAADVLSRQGSQAGSHAGAASPPVGLAAAELPTETPNDLSREIEENVAGAEVSPHNQAPGYVAVQDAGIPDDIAQLPLALASSGVVAAHSSGTDQRNDSGPHRRRHGGALPA